MKTTLISVLLVFLTVFQCPAEEKTGYATYYTTESCQKEGTSGVYTASGQRFDESAFTCALPRRGWGGWYRVTNTKTGACVFVKHNDYGPGKGPQAKGVVIDLTPTAFMALGAKLKDGRVRVKYERLTDSEVKVLKKQGRL